MDKNIGFLEKIAQDIKTKKKSKAETKGMTVEQAVRVAIIKQMYKLGYKSDNLLT